MGLLPQLYRIQGILLHSHSSSRLWCSEIRTRCTNFLRPGVDLNTTDVVVNRHVEDRWGGGGEGGGGGGGGGSGGGGGHYKKK
ncbi:hypothetical protein Tco_0091290 [Tanacetum coccineum]